MPSCRCRSAASHASESLLGVFVYSLALWNPLRQGLHDQAAGTLVVRNHVPGGRTWVSQRSLRR